MAARGCEMGEEWTPDVATPGVHRTGAIPLVLARSGLIRARNEEARSHGLPPRTRGAEPYQGYVTVTIVLRSPHPRG